VFGNIRRVIKAGFFIIDALLMPAFKHTHNQARGTGAGQCSCISARPHTALNEVETHFVKHEVYYLYLIT